MSIVSHKVLIPQPDCYGDYEPTPEDWREFSAWLSESEADHGPDECLELPDAAYFEPSDLEPEPTTMAHDPVYLRAMAELAELEAIVARLERRLDGTYMDDEAWLASQNAYGDSQVPDEVEMCTVSEMDWRLAEMEMDERYVSWNDLG